MYFDFIERRDLDADIGGTDWDHIAGDALIYTKHQENITRKVCINRVFLDFLYT